MLKRTKSLTEQAADEIRARIVRGDFPLGAPLSENALAGEMGVSKTPIREALLQLKMEGLVSILPQRGSFVFDMTAQEIAALCELRDTLERAALRLAAGRQGPALVAALAAICGEMELALAADDLARYRALDAAFHQSLFDHCGNSFFVSCYQSFAFRVQALRVRLTDDPAFNARSIGEHRRMTELLAGGRVEEACALLAVHIDSTAVQYVGILQPPGDESVA
ncbi:DNA-binding transcriptional regulator, GntR family [Tistlia consotensis]|uniref:DNA-binding transcriptional regulator, GntR family n=1 Tax=Tistlia consotensis USBA 355 TaxID=560819 RepID=A0A1Y6C083_9PROT|nr:GntR family transcriptional regulator [Tistlia consotensis]SMF38806.1 DNA-binding transcriptional regulator, GntR family [Tistlia consotensis USBA 355]SNR36824.1 DNA-binding transcriptional regulator, GntR family [Tistlia consotensis]